MKADKNNEKKTDFRRRRQLKLTLFSHHQTSLHHWRRAYSIQFYFNPPQKWSICL